MPPTIHGFIQTWKNSAGNERANKDSFLRELCEALEIGVPGPKDQHSDYCFEKDLKITIQDLGWHLDGRYLKQQSDISSVCYWYQTDPHGNFPRLPDWQSLEVN